MFIKLKNKNRLLAVMIANTFFCILFIVGCGQGKNEISLSDKDACTEESGSDDSGKQKDTAEKENENIFVYISGAVKMPGVYTVKEGSRIFHIIKQAGGLTKSAEQDYLNQAETVVDGQNIRVLTKKEYAEMKEKEQLDIFDKNNNKTADGKININSADVATLMQLPGIGETKAKTIVSYREENGSFTAIEDIKNVSGIGDSTFANICENITVN